MTDKPNLTCLKALLASVMTDIKQKIATKSNDTKNKMVAQNLNALIDSFSKGDLIVFSGRPGMGKTSFVLNIAERISICNNQPMILFCPGINKKTLTLKLLCLNAKVAYSHTSHGYLTNDGHQKLINSARLIANAPIYMDDTPIVSLKDIETKIRKANKYFCLLGKKLSLVVIDYLQLIGEATDRSRKHVSGVLKHLKDIAIKNDVTMLVISETKRVDNAPYFSDTIETASEVIVSGCADHADTVIVLSREGYYDKDIGEERREFAELHILRSSCFYESDLPILFKREFFRFEDR